MRSLPILRCKLIWRSLSWHNPCSNNIAHNICFFWVFDNVDSQRLVEECKNDNPKNKEKEISDNIANYLLNEHHNILKSINKNNDVHYFDDHSKDNIAVNDRKDNLWSHVFLLIYYIVWVIWQSSYVSIFNSP